MLGEGEHQPKFGELTLLQAVVSLTGVLTRRMHGPMRLRV